MQDVDASAQEILRVDGLSVEFPGADGAAVRVVDGVSFALTRGETLGVVGESGSGKSITALSLLALVPAPGRVVEGRIALLGRDLASLSEGERRALRGSDIGIVFQDPMTGLNPVRRVGSMLIESVRRHQRVSAAAAHTQALEALAAVGIPSPELRLRSYPHELSGGLRQRVMIALALINHPSVIVADEPTTALDATIQAQILELLRARVSATAALLMITHDLGVAAELCDRVAVMYHGRIVEYGTTDSILSAPRHPYTEGLLRAVPRFDFDRPDLVPIPGAPPRPGDKITGCAFAPRCNRASPRCVANPELRHHAGGEVACWYPGGGEEDV